MSGKALRGLPGRPYTTMRRARGCVGLAAAARSVADRRGSKANSWREADALGVERVAQQRRC